MEKDEAPENYKEEICLTIWERQLLLKSELSLLYKKQKGYIKYG